jgi:[DsrC]-trisulfide reductase subunit J
MYDAGKIITGLLVFLVLVTTPVWFNAATHAQAQAPQLKVPEGVTACVEPTAEMRASHMDLLNEWRNAAVRSDERFFTMPDGKVYEKSLSLTCLKCHDNKEEFCDRCHNYLAVSPYCWDCHVEPKGGRS